MLFLPTDLTLSSLNLIAWPSLVEINISSEPELVLTAINSSLLFKFIAIIPFALGLEYSSNLVFLIIPLLVVIIK